MRSKQHSYNKSDENISNLTKEMAKGGGIAFLGSIIGRAIRFGFQVLLGRVLGTAMYGLYALGTSVTGIINSTAVLGMQNGAVRFGAMYWGEDNKFRLKGVINQSFGISLISGLGAGIILYYYSNYISVNIFHNVELGIVLRIFAFSIPFYIFQNVAIAFFQVARQIAYQVALQNFFLPITNIVLVALFFLLGFRLMGAAYAYTISGILSAACGIYFLWRLLPDTLHKVKALYNIKEFLRFSIPTYLVTIAYFMTNYVDKIMLGYFGRVEDVGIYGAAATIALQMILFLNAFIYIFSPMVSDLHNKGQSYEFSRLFKTVTRWIFSLTFPLFIVVVFFSKNIMSIFGVGFIKGWQVLVILSLSQLVNACTGPVGIILQMSGKQDVELLNGVGLILLNVGLNLWLIPIFGIVGAAIATAVALALVNIIKLLEVIWFYKLFPYSKRYFIPIATGIMMAVFLYFFFDRELFILYDWKLIIVSSLIALTGYVVTIYRLGLSAEDELVLSVIKKRVNLQRK